MKIWKLLVVVTLGSLAQVAWSNDVGLKAFRADAKALCDVYKPENWQPYLKDNNQDELYQKIGVRIREVIKTKEFAQIYERYLNDHSLNMHDYVHQEVSKLIGEDWKCSDFDQFHSPGKRKVIQLTVKGIKEVVAGYNEKQILLTIDNAGKYYVNDKPLINSEEATLTQAIKITANNTKNGKPHIVIRSDEAAPTGALLTAIYVAKKLGIQNVSLEIQE